MAWINSSPRGAAQAYESLRLVLGYAHARIVTDACADIAVTPDLIGDDGLIADLDIKSKIRRALAGLSTTP